MATKRNKTLTKVQLPMQKKQVLPVFLRFMKIGDRMKRIQKAAKYTSCRTLEIFSSCSQFADVMR